MAFVAAALIEIAAVGCWALMQFAASMSDDRQAGVDFSREANWVLLAGSVVAVLVALSHWDPRW